MFFDSNFYDIDNFKKKSSKQNKYKKKLVKTLPFTLYYAEKKKKTRHRQIFETNPWKEI